MYCTNRHLTKKQEEESIALLQETDANTKRHIAIHG